MPVRGYQRLAENVKKRVLRRTCIPACRSFSRQLLRAIFLVARGHAPEGPAQANLCCKLPCRKRIIISRSQPQMIAWVSAPLLRCPQSDNFDRIRTGCGRPWQPPGRLSLMNGVALVLGAMAVRVLFPFELSRVWRPK